MKILIIQATFLCIFSLLYAIPIDSNDSDAEYGVEYQGDIKLTLIQENELKEEGRNGRTGTLNTNMRWPKINGKVTVPYIIDGYSEF